MLRPDVSFHQSDLEIVGARRPEGLKTPARHDELAGAAHLVGRPVGAAEAALSFVGRTRESQQPFCALDGPSVPAPRRSEEGCWLYYAVGLLPRSAPPHSAH